MTPKINKQKHSNLHSQFQKYAFSAIKISQSPSMTVDGNTFAIVGQHIFRSPLYSHFDVMDHNGERADEQVAEIVYAYSSMIQITSYLVQLQTNVEKARAKERDLNEDLWMGTDIERMVRSRFKKEYDEDFSNLKRVNRKILPLFQELQTQAEHLSKLDHLTLDSFQVFYRVWKAFWK